MGEISQSEDSIVYILDKYIMTFIWDAKNNFILLHFVTLHQEQSSTLDINWSSIVNDIHLEISATPILLKTQFEHLLENFYPKNDSKSLYSALKHTYLHSLCQKIEDDVKLTLESVYELTRHARAKRINDNDIEQLINECNLNYSSDEQKENKERLFNILNRLRGYIHTLPNNYYQSIYYHLPERTNTNQLSTIQKDINDEAMEVVPACYDEIPAINQQNELINLDNNRLISNTIEQEKSPLTRRRTQSLTIFTENKDNKVNIGVEWFVPKFIRQQRSSSLHAPYQSPSPIDSLSSQNLVSTGILMTTIDNDGSSNSTRNSKLRQTDAQPAISWLPLTNEQIVEKKRRQVELKLIDEQQLDQVSSTDSDSIEIQWSTSSTKKASRSSSSHDLHQHQQEHNSCKRQRLS